MLDNVAGSKDSHRNYLDESVNAAVLNDSLNNNTIKYFDQSLLDSSDGGALDTSLLSSGGDSANGASTDSTCDNSLGSVETQPPQPYPRSILNTSSTTTSSADSVPRAIPRPLTKKSVSFDTDTDGKVQKFVDGDVIVDQKNPFKSASALRREEFFSAPTVQPAKVPVSLDNEEFITTEDVLKESKFVKTYVKNPDKYFERDPSVLAKLRQEIQDEQKRSIPVRRSKLSKYSPSSIYAKAQVKINGSNSSPSRLQPNRSYDRSRYPDLSQIKVKVGTDLEQSLYNPDEVALNAKRFDDRIKNSSFGSQDDLDDIADFTSDTVDFPEVTLTSEEEKPQKSFTNTVNSAEFQEFLNKKGLSLTPQSPPKHNDQSTINPKDTMSEMEQKKVKKPSVLQRLFPGRHIFSSKRKTTPKDPLPEPKTIYATLSDEEIHKTPEIKRVILERQSFHAGQSGGAEIAKQLRDQTRKSQMDDGSSSISSALTNAENYLDMNQLSAVATDTLRKNENKENYIEMSVPVFNNSDHLRKQGLNQKSENDEDKPRLKSQIARPKSTSGRSSAPLISRIEKIEQSRLLKNCSATGIASKLRKEAPLVFQSESPDVRDGTVIKPRAQRPNMASNPSPPPKAIKPPVPLRRTPDRQSLNFKKPIAAEDPMEGLRRAASLDKAEIKKRSAVKPLIRAKPINLQSIHQQTLPIRKVTKRPESGFLETNLDNDVTPKNSVNNLVSNGQLLSSTPITASDQPNFYFHKKPISSSISPISPVPTTKKNNDQINSPSKKLQLDPYSWAKLRELKEQTDRQLYSKPLVTQSNKPAAPLSRDHIYGRSEEPPLPENIYEKLPRHRNRNSMAARVESTNPLVQIQEKAQVHVSPQDQYRQQMIQLQQQYQQQQQQQQQLFFEELNRQKEYQEQQLKAQLQKQLAEQRLEQQRHLQNQQRQHNSNFVRNTPQRNTIGDIYRNRDLKLVDGNYVVANGPSTDNSARPRSQYPSEQEINAPVRCQSVLGNMVNDAYHQRNSPNPVVMRQKPVGKMSREEIMSRVTDFCRKSMNKTPTKHFQSSSADDQSAKISPVSYNTESRNLSSLSSLRSVGKPSPQVPQRVQSLSNKQNNYNSCPESPIYTPVFKRSSVQSSTASDLYDNPSGRPVRNNSASRPQTYSETDSVILPTKSQRAYYIMDSNQVTPNHLMTYEIPKTLRGSTDTYNSRQSIDSYGRIYQPLTENIYDSLPPPQAAAAAAIQRPSQIYYPINGTLRRNQIQLNAASGRATPLILQAIPQQPVYGTSTKQQQRNAPDSGPARPESHYPGTIIVLDNVEQLYRPIVPTPKVMPTSRPLPHQPLAVHRNYVKSGKYIVPFDSESASEAEEMQRIFQTSKNGEWIAVVVDIIMHRWDLCFGVKIN